MSNSSGSSNSSAYNPTNGVFHSAPTPVNVVNLRAPTTVTSSSTQQGAVSASSSGGLTSGAKIALLLVGVGGLALIYHAME